MDSLKNQTDFAKKLSFLSISGMLLTFCLVKRQKNCECIISNLKMQQAMAKQNHLNSGDLSSMSKLDCCSSVAAFHLL